MIVCGTALGGLPRDTMRRTFDKSDTMPHSEPRQGYADKLRKRPKAAPRKRDTPAPAPVSSASTSPPLPADSSAADAFRLIARSLLHTIAVQQPAVRRADPAGVHQMRIALRRMRAAIAIFGPMVDDRESRRLRAELKWLAGRLAPARDLHLLELKFASAQLGGGSPLFLKKLGHDRAAAFTRARTTVEQPRFRRLLRDLRHWIDGDDWSEAAGPDAERPAKGFARHILAHRTQKLVQHCDRLDELDDSARHQVRIKAKKLYYATGFFESLFAGHGSGKQLARFKKQLKKLLDALGVLNDIAVHRELTGKFADRPKAKLDNEAAAQLSDLDTAEIRRQMKAALKAAGKLADRPLFGD